MSFGRKSFCMQEVKVFARYVTRYHRKQSLNIQGTGAKCEIRS